VPESRSPTKSHIDLAGIDVMFAAFFLGNHPGIAFGEWGWGFKIAWKRVSEGL
jgi:hypothetical protein